MCISGRRLPGGSTGPAEQGPGQTSATYLDPSFKTSASFPHGPVHLLVSAHGFIVYWKCLQSQLQVDVRTVFGRNIFNSFLIQIFSSCNSGCFVQVFLFFPNYPYLLCPGRQAALSLPRPDHYHSRIILPGDISSLILILLLFASSLLYISQGGCWEPYSKYIE